MRVHLRNPFLDQALTYARAGWPVLPLFEVWNGRCACDNNECGSPGKHPRTRHGVRDATADPDIITDWWTRWPSANIGIATGLASNLIVVDIDGDEGRTEWQEITRHRKSLPPGCLVLTGNGQHLYFRSGDKPIGNSTRALGSKVHVRGDGGYVVAARSRHVTGKHYRQPGKPPYMLKPAALPLWLADRLQGAALASAGSTGSPQDQRYGLAALEGEVNAILGAQKGQRNDQLNRSAFRVGQLVAAGALNEGEVTLKLMTAAQQVGLGDSEIARTLLSGLEAGKKQPRAVPTRQADFASTRQLEPPDPLDEELAQLDQTDADNARRLVRRFGDKLVCTPGRGWLVYDDGRWQPDSKLARFALAEQAARLIAKEARYRSDGANRTAFAQQSLSKSALDRMIEVARHSLMKDDKQFDDKPWLLNVANGTIDLQTGTLGPHRREDLLTKMLPIEFERDARAPVFTGLIQAMFDGDGELSTFVQKAVGLTLTGVTTEQVFFFCFGPGATGKSTLLNTIRDMLGEYGRHTPFSTFLSKSNDTSIPTDLARLDGARMVTAIEANFNQAFDEARIKAITGGEPIAARHLYKDFFEFKPQLKLWIAANDLPKARSTDDAFWRRVRVIPFDVPVAERDRDQNLVEKLKAEYAGILAWAVRGCLAWQREGLGMPARVRDATKAVKSKADHLRRFALEELILDPRASERSSFLFQHYTRWCEQEGEKPLSQKRFNAALSDLDYGPPKRDSEGTRWPGLKIRTG